MFSLSSYIPNDITQHAKFIRGNPKFDGRGLLIAILDDGVDVSCPGMQKTSTGIPKILDCFDFTGAGNVDTSTIKEADKNNKVIGLSGRTLKIPSKWKNPSGQWHLGKKSFHELTQTYKHNEHGIMLNNKNWTKRDIIKNKKRKDTEKAFEEKDKCHNDYIHVATDLFKDHIMHVSGLPTNDFSSDLFEEFLNKYSPVAYIVYKQNFTEAYIRFHSTEKNVAIKVLNKINGSLFENAKKRYGKMQFQGQEIQCKVLVGEEEDKFWAEVLEGEEEENYCANLIINNNNKLAKGFQNNETLK
uniref:XRRM domain-containing protein n=1 Tax=Panagrolaimus sp. ES5 TaxID=591445 RepID=A0AC34G977_9BILA